NQNDGDSRRKSAQAKIHFAQIGLNEYTSNFCAVDRDVAENVERILFPVRTTWAHVCFRRGCAVAIKCCKNRAVRAEYTCKSDSSIDLQRLKNVRCAFYIVRPDLRSSVSPNGIRQNRQMLNELRLVIQAVIRCKCPRSNQQCNRSNDHDH